MDQAMIDSVPTSHVSNITLAVLFLLYRLAFWVVMFFLFVYLSVPVLLYLFPVSFGSFLIFTAKPKWPFTKYYDLKGLGVANAGRNVRINSTEPGVTLGVWEIMSSNTTKVYNNHDLKDATVFEECMRTTGKGMFVYVHGKASSRANRVRVSVYNFLCSLDFHVVTFDFRGFGDSGGRPSETGAVEDLLSVVEHVKALVPNVPLFVWGHSLGTAIAVQAVAELSRRCNSPDAVRIVGLVLEAPFNNLTMAIKHHTLNKAYVWIPMIEKWIIEPSTRLIPIRMFTDLHICDVNCPILMLHAEDDATLPINLSHDLYASAIKAGKDVQLVEFAAERKFGHKFIVRAVEMPEIVTTFIEKSLKLQESAIT